MGHGDNLMATGMARGAKARGKRIAFGDRKRIIWDQHSAEVFRGNPNIAKPGSERDNDVEWVEFYKGHRIYNQQAGGKWLWNREFRPTPGEVFFDKQELRNASRYGKGFVLIEPNVPRWKTVAPNKDWGAHRYQHLANSLRVDDYRMLQFSHPAAPVQLKGVEQVKTQSFREALAVLANAALYIGAGGCGGWRPGRGAVRRVYPAQRHRLRGAREPDGRG
jgi:hypothetical protein